MSHAVGALKFKDGSIRWYEYNGTCDVVISYHYKTQDEVQNKNNWRSDKWVDCDCGKAEKVSIFSSYGGGFYMEGMACKKCKSVSEIETEDYHMDREKVADDWAEEFFPKWK